MLGFRTAGLQAVRAAVLSLVLAVLSLVLAVLSLGCQGFRMASAGQSWLLPGCVLCGVVSLVAPLMVSLDVSLAVSLAVSLVVPLWLSGALCALWGCPGAVLCSLGSLWLS